METTTLGRGGPVVSRAGLGLMGMSGIYGEADDQESIATIRAALDAGITLLDTGDFYGMGHNELLIGRALRDRPGKALLSVKFGAQRAPDGAFLVGHQEIENAAVRDPQVVNPVDVLRRVDDPPAADAQNAHAIDCKKRFRACSAVPGDSRGVRAQTYAHRCAFAATRPVSFSCSQTLATSRSRARASHMCFATTPTFSDTRAR